MTRAYGVGALLFLATISCHLRPPVEPGPFREADLVELSGLDPTIHLDIRLATSSNFLGKAVYAQGRAFLQRPAAEALVRVNETLRGDGYGLLVTDAYRPWSVTQILWDSVSEKDREGGFVANPKEGSKHNRGCAVDVTLYVLQTGLEVEMPSAVDEFTERANVNYEGASEEARRLRDLLRHTMESQGFAVYEGEWWHFDYKDWREYRLMNVPFEALP